MKITQQNYVTEAEKAIKDICNNRNYLSTSQIRKILAMVSDIYNDARRIPGSTLDESMLGRIQYLKLHVVYEAGRDQKVKDFVKRTDLLNQIDNIKNQKDRLILFCHYMEALVAYRKYLGGKDD